MEYIPIERITNDNGAVGITELRHQNKKLVIKITASAETLTTLCQHPTTGEWHSFLSEIMSEQDEHFWYTAIFLEDPEQRSPVWVLALDQHNRSQACFTQYIAPRTQQLFDDQAGKPESFMAAFTSLSHLLEWPLP